MQVQIKENQTYTITLTGSDVITIQSALLEIPAKFANPILDKIGTQINNVEDIKEAV